MARPIQGDAILEVTNVGEQHGHRIMNVWHWQFKGAASPVVDGDAVRVLLSDLIQPGNPAGLLEQLRSWTNENVTWQAVRYQWISPIRYSATGINTGGGPGAIVANSLPPNVAAVATIRGIFAGPGFTGRKHFGGLSIDQVAAGMIDDGLKTDVAGVLQLMGQVIDTTAVQLGSQLIPVVYDRVNPAGSTMWTNYTVQDTSRVLRRRTVGVGI